MSEEHVVSSVTVSIELEAPAAKVFGVASDHFQLPRWADPVREVRMHDGRHEVEYMLPDGVVTCPCEGRADAASGVADWTVHLPKGGELRVFSRTLPLGESRSVFLLTLLSPPMPRRRLKDAYGVVQKNLLRDLGKFKELAEKPPAAPEPRRSARRKKA